MISIKDYHARYQRWTPYRLAILNQVEFTAYTVSADRETINSIRKHIERVPENVISNQAIDKISFTFHRDFLNEDCNWWCLNLSFATVKVHGEYFTVHFHREYINPYVQSISDHLWMMFRYLILCTPLFKLPVLKRITIGTSDTVLEEKEFKENYITTADEFFSMIYKQRRLKCIELCFDVHKHLTNYVLWNEFKPYDGTLYSNDFKIYDTGCKRWSILSIYDKAREQRERKHRNMQGTLYRFEIRLRSERFIIMKKDRGHKLLNQGYEDLLDDLMPCILKQIRKLGITVDMLKEALPENQKTLREILNSL